MEELNWYNNYYSQLDQRNNLKIDFCQECSNSNTTIGFSNEEELNKVISLFQKIESENKIFEIEKEYSESLNRIEELYEKENLEEYVISKNSKILLKEELDIIRLLSKYTLQNNYIDYNFFFKSIKLLYKISEILRERINQDPIIHKNKNFNSYIPRCSYKFCSFKDNCFYNYNLKNKNVCYQDHYVHNMVSADLVILEEYIDFKFNDKNLIVPNKEILKTINTLSFVISHMQTELNSKCLYLNDDECEKMHYVKKNK